MLENFLCDVTCRVDGLHFLDHTPLLDLFLKGFSRKMILMQDRSLHQMVVMKDLFDEWWYHMERVGPCHDETRLFKSKSWLILKNLFKFVQKLCCDNRLIGLSSQFEKFPYDFTLI